MDTIARDKLAATARTHARITGSSKGTSVVCDHARLLSGELVPSEQISVTRPAANEPWVDGGPEFKVGPYFTTNVSSKRSGSAVVAVFADDEAIGDLYRDERAGTWVAFGPTDLALTRPTTFEAAWNAITHLHVAAQAVQAEPVICNALDGNEIGYCQAILAADGTCPGAHHHAAAKFARERDERITEALRQVRTALVEDAKLLSDVTDCTHESRYHELREIEDALGRL